MLHSFNYDDYETISMFPQKKFAPNFLTKGKLSHSRKVRSSKRKAKKKASCK